ncbi:uncharacterized protein CC84DRAFT_1203789 [Paraphaeosphaeria sporulosa]|uniref:Uncharacterized protein n=1 Tax=Paraphaeosphaeria sporulosa TaxID=1460663 RepID=A0A177CLL1_9PLEO|nr:uncharacterized protein CC84DRAFT_1203789 [Paraphaeosphaeria sporulosa]OAG08403.1 hypothetical protein CC84DRAFT_1203789 [Paraphaeosphaeria sporulosa]
MANTSSWRGFCTVYINLAQGLHQEAAKAASHDTQNRRNQRLAMPRRDIAVRDENIAEKDVLIAQQEDTIKAQHEESLIKLYGEDREMVKKIYREDREARESLVRATIEAVDRELSAAIYDGALSSDGEPNDDGEGVIAAERDDAVLQVVAGQQVEPRYILGEASGLSHCFHVTPRRSYEDGCRYCWSKETISQILSRGHGIRGQ